MQTLKNFIYIFFSVRRRQHDLFRHRDRDVLRAEHGRLGQLQEPFFGRPAGLANDLRLRPDVLHLSQSEGDRARFTKTDSNFGVSFDTH